MDVHFLMSIFRLYRGLNMSFEHNSVCKNLFLCACFFWDSGLFLSEMSQEFKFGGTIGYGNSYVKYLVRQLKAFRLHAILHDAAGAVRAHSGKGPGCCYMIGLGPNSSLLGHVTGLLFCLYVKVFPPSFFKFVNFWSSMCCIAVDIEPADKNVIKELRVFIDGKVHWYSFPPPKKYKPTKQAFWCTRNLHRIVQNSGRLDYNDLSNILPREL